MGGAIHSQDLEAFRVCRSFLWLSSINIREEAVAFDDGPLHVSQESDGSRTFTAVAFDDGPLHVFEESEGTHTFTHCHRLSQAASVVHWMVWLCCSVGSTGVMNGHDSFISEYGDCFDLVCLS